MHLFDNLASRLCHRDVSVQPSTAYTMRLFHEFAASFWRLLAMFVSPSTIAA